MNSSHPLSKLPWLLGACLLACTAAPATPDPAGDTTAPASLIPPELQAGPESTPSAAQAAAAPPAAAVPDHSAEGAPADPAAQALVLPGSDTPVVTIEQRTLNGLTFDVRTAGPKNGELVMLLHGFPESSYEWRHQLPLLAAAGYHVIAPDLRGTSPGARPTAAADYGLLNMLGDVLALADSYGAQRFHLVGHDVGALLAWGTAQFFGGRLKTLTAVSVPHPGAFAAQLADPNSCQSRASAWYQDLIKPGAAARLLAGDPPILLDAWASLGPDAEAEYRRLLGTPEALDAVINLWRANFIDGQPQGALPLPVFVPTLYIWGDTDPYNCGDGERLTRTLSWGSYRFETLRDVGHFVPEEAPEHFYALLFEHLRSQRF